MALYNHVQTKFLQLMAIAKFLKKNLLRKAKNLFHQDAGQNGGVEKYNQNLIRYSLLKRSYPEQCDG